jgi:amino acid adenylation domain-containing protein
MAHGMLTYRELGRATNGVANVLHGLRGAGAEPIALLLDHQAAVPAAMLGILKIGKFYVPLDPSSPSERTLEILSDIQTKLIITDRTHSALAKSFCKEGCLSLCIEDIQPTDSMMGLEVSIRPEDLACVLYTSGSTGKPKGVMHTHRSLLHKVMRHTNGRRISAQDRIALLFSYNFGASMTNTFSALLNGATLAPFSLPQGGVAQLAQWLQAEEITIVHTVPTVFRRLLDSLNAALEFPNLRLIRLGGETIYRSDVERFQKHFADDCILHLGMGSSETGVVLECFFDKKTPCASDLAPAGYAAEGVTVLLLDEGGREVGDECVGEIAVKGRSLSPGYWKNSELTKAVFHPCPEGNGDRIYLTGDLGYRLPDGCVFHMGRKDSQVKIRGSRVELGEVEAALLNINGVREAAVIARQDLSGTNRLAAYVALHDPSALSIQDLRGALRKKLPRYMLPESLEVLPGLPLLPSGKIDRLALSPCRPMACASDNPDAARLTLLETQLCGIWKRILGLPGFGVHDDFFDLGGDSLLAVQMICDVEELCGKKVSLGNFPDGLTIERLARALHDGTDPIGQPVGAIQAGGSKRPFFFLHGDFESGGLYCRNFARQLGPDQPLYAVAPHGSDGRVIPETVEAMAADYVGMLVNLQPLGPILLGGFCNGGVVAYEVARQLEEQGRKVNTVLMIDSRNRNARFCLAGKLKDVLALTFRMNTRTRRKCFMRLRWYSEGLAEASRRGPLSLVLFTLAKLSKVPLAFWQFLTEGAGSRHRSDISPKGEELTSFSSPSDRFAAVRQPLHEALEEYIPGRFGGRVVLFRSSTHLARFPGDPTAGWGSVAGKVEVHNLSAGHRASLTTEVADLAGKILPYLSNENSQASGCHSCNAGERK